VLIYRSSEYSAGECVDEGSIASVGLETSNDEVEGIFNIGVAAGPHSSSAENGQIPICNQD